VPGQLGWVSLPTYQQSLLKRMDRALEARDPRLASMFAIFTRLTSDDGPPRAERLGPRSASLAVALRWTRTSAAIPVVIVIALTVAIIALGVATSGGRVCPPTVTVHLSGHSKLAGCQAADGLLKLARYDGSPGIPVGPVSG
jgi:hypothetical protein